ncbi:hypothetical protein PHISP_05640 [Aspergillus sp. HF37]|nr:hypothetical protein PHISP_05640 [Aspergillus sp. HF37]
MARGVTRSIHFCDLATDFLHHILYNEIRSTILVVCSTRDRFLEQVYAAARTQAGEPGRHPLLAKSIGMLSKSSRVKLAFCPTLEHLRAYISVLRMDRETDSDKRPVLAVLDLLALHIPTLEFSAQGLSRTLAMTVEVAAHEGMDLVLCECRNAVDPTNSDYGERLWYEHVPILNGSVRMGGEESGWGARGVPVKRVAERWFNFNESSRATTGTVNV